MFLSVNVAQGSRNMCPIDAFIQARRISHWDFSQTRRNCQYCIRGLTMWKQKIQAKNVTSSADWTWDLHLKWLVSTLRVYFARIPYSAQAQLPPPSHPENENLVRTWHLEFQVGKKLAKIPPPLMTYVEGAGVWRLIAVFPKETVSFGIV